MRDLGTIVVVGGGVYVDALVRALPEDARGTIRLVARRLDRLRTIAHHADALAGRLGRDVRVVACDALVDALRGATSVVLMLRVHGHAARAHDERFPGRYGRVGDEGLGLGGVANAWRTLPVFEALGETLATHAPDVPIANLVAPLGITTRALVDAGRDVDGLCELPLLTERRLGLHGRDYAGLNHLGWFAGPPVDHPEVDPDVVREGGGVPLKYVLRLLHPEVAARRGVQADPRRAAALHGLDRDVMRQYRERPGEDVPALALRPCPWFDHALVPWLLARAGHGTVHGFANGPYAAPWAPSGVVIEARVRLGSGRPDPTVPTDLPAPITSFLRTAAEAEDRLYRAARSRDPDALRPVLAGFPNHLPEAVHDAVIDDVLAPPEAA